MRSSKLAAKSFNSKKFFKVKTLCSSIQIVPKVDPVLAHSNMGWLRQELLEAVISLRKGLQHSELRQLSFGRQVALDLKPSPSAPLSLVCHHVEMRKNKADLVSVGSVSDHMVRMSYPTLRLRSQGNITLLEVSRSAAVQPSWHCIYTHSSAALYRIVKCVRHPDGSETISSFTVVCSLLAPCGSIIARCISISCVRCI